MENSKGQTLFLSVIGVASLLVAIIGATFAWFSVDVTGNANAQSVYVETMKLGSVTYTDSNAITLTNVKPITASEVGEDNIKSFSVAQTDATATEELSYVISLDIAENTLTGVAEGYFKHSLSGESSKTENAGTLVSVDLSAVPAATTDLGTGSLKGYETHTYTYTIYLEEANKAQNEAQGAKFSGKIQVRLSDTQYGG